MTRTGQTREEWIGAQREREDQAREALVAGVARLANRQGWADWLGLVTRLPHYSLSNQLLLVSQRADVSMVMSAAQWREVGRWPAKGSHALRIWAPSRRRTGGAGGEQRPAREADPGSGQAPRDERDRPRFVLVPVFDVAQTEGEPLPSAPDPVAPPSGQAPAGMWQALVDYATAAGFTVGVGDTGTADGVTNFATATITVAERGSELAQTLTLAHEIGHMALHGDPATRDPAGVHRGRAEVQAESVAYLVAHAYGLQEAAEWHFDYLAHWAARVGTDAGAVVAAEARETAAGVLSAARPLLEHLAEACVGFPDPLREPAPPAPAVAVMAR